MFPEDSIRFVSRKESRDMGRNFNRQRESQCNKDDNKYQGKCYKTCNAIIFHSLYLEDYGTIPRALLALQ